MNFRVFLKHTLNRLTIRLAESKHTSFAIVRHIGRRSGKTYETPIIVEPITDGFLIALTYGPNVDWYRNVIAADRCQIRWHGKEYTVDHVEPVATQAALPVYPRILRSILRLRGTHDFVKLRTNRQPSPAAILAEKAR